MFRQDQTVYPVQFLIVKLLVLLVVCVPVLNAMLATFQMVLVVVFYVHL